MKPTTDIVEELRLYNRWRRGDEAITAPDPTALGKLLDDAADRIEHLFASGIHTCHADCQRPMCVLRRERDKAHADLARVTAERDEAKSEAESALDTCARTLDERDALRARVADYEERLSAVMPSDFKDWNQNARSEWPEVAARVMQSLVEREHFANGTAELAMHDELFPAESVAQDSPRLAWMKRHDIHTDKMHDYDEEEKPWSAWVGDLEKAISDGGDNPEAGGYSVAKTEDDALAILAKARGLRLWNEEEAP